MNLKIGMKKTVITFLKTVSFLFFAFSCQKNKTEISPRDFGQNYVPFSDSMSIVYKVTKTEFLFQHTDVSTSYQKELFVLDTNTSDPTDFVIYRFVKANLEDEWVVDSIYAGFKSDKEYVKIENNVAKLNVVFEPYKKREWNKNAYNTEKSVNWYVQAKDTSYHYNELKSDKALIIQSPENLETFISSNEEFEVYGYNLGLIHQYKRDLKYQPGKDTVGFILDKVYIGE